MTQENIVTDGKDPLIDGLPVETAMLNGDKPKKADVLAPKKPNKEGMDPQPAASISLADLNPGH